MHSLTHKTLFMVSVIIWIHLGFWLFADHWRNCGRSDGSSRHASKKSRDGSPLWCLYCLTRFVQHTPFSLLNSHFTLPHFNHRPF